MVQKKSGSSGKSKEKKKKSITKINTLYEKKGNSLTRKNPFCPKCGQGHFMANHKDRYTCGKCGYMEKK